MVKEQSQMKTVSRKVKAQHAAAQGGQQKTEGASCPASSVSRYFVLGTDSRRYYSKQDKAHKAHKAALRCFRHMDHDTQYRFTHTQSTSD
jgi:hypothetical protein